MAAVFGSDCLNPGGSIHSALKKNYYVLCQIIRYLLYSIYPFLRERDWLSQGMGVLSVRWLYCTLLSYYNCIPGWRFILIYALNKKRLLLRCIHHFKSDVIYNMDHMHISGTEPSSVILSHRQWSLAKQCNFKSWKVMSQKCRNKLKPMGMV